MDVRNDRQSFTAAEIKEFVQGMVRQRVLTRVWWGLSRLPRPTLRLREWLFDYDFDDDGLSVIWPYLVRTTDFHTPPNLEGWEHCPESIHYQRTWDKVAVLESDDYDPKTVPYREHLEDIVFEWDNDYSFKLEDFLADLADKLGLTEVSVDAVFEEKPWKLGVLISTAGNRTAVYVALETERATLFDSLDKLEASNVSAIVALVPPGPTAHIDGETGRPDGFDSILGAAHIAKLRASAVHTLCLDDVFELDTSRKAILSRRPLEQLLEHLPRSDAHLTEPISAPSSLAINEFRQVGPDKWHISLKGCTPVESRSYEGYRYIARLLSAPGRRWPKMELIGMVQGSKPSREGFSTDASPKAAHELSIEYGSDEKEPDENPKELLQLKKVDEMLTQRMEAARSAGRTDLFADIEEKLEKVRTRIRLKESGRTFAQRDFRKTTRTVSQEIRRAVVRIAAYELSARRGRQISPDSVTDVEITDSDSPIAAHLSKYVRTDEAKVYAYLPDEAIEWIT